MKRRLSTYAATLLLVGLVPAAAGAFPAQDEQSPGGLALGFRKQNKIWSRFDAGVLDGKIKTSPPDTTVYDRRSEAAAQAGFDAVVSQRFGVRVDAKSEYSRRRQAGDAAAPVSDERKIVNKGALDLTFVTDKGLEIFGGIMGDFHEPYERRDKTDAGTTTTSSMAGHVFARRFGVIRRAGQWGGGFYYIAGSESSRKVRSEAFDGSSHAASEVVFIPSQMGLVGEITGGLLVWDFDLAFIQARGKGPRDENGKSAYTDSFSSRVGALAKLGAINLKLAGSYRTLSYASNSFVTIDTVPVSTVRLLALFGDPQKTHTFFGVIGAYAKDGQSLREFNATYEFTGTAVTSGINFGF